MKIVTIIGARPQFVKASVVSKALKEANVAEYIINTGQHYDDNMAQIFFEEMSIPKPDINLGVGSGSHGEQTARTLIGIENELFIQKPDIVLVYGDTNATIAGALAASKLHIPIAHIEAGLRSFNRLMPEEINRVVTDVISDYLFCPTKLAVKNLADEGITEQVYNVGDVMYDALLHFTQIAEKSSDALSKLNLIQKSYYLMTIHRPVNANNTDQIQQLLNVLKSSPYDIVFPLHPRTKNQMEKSGILSHPKIKFVEPVGYLDMMMLEKNAKAIVTDSGGVQKEAYLHKVPCLTLRNETEWKETVADGWNTLVKDIDEIPHLLNNLPRPKIWQLHYGNGNAASQIVNILLSCY